MPRTAVRLLLITALIATLPGHAEGRSGAVGIVRGAEALYVREGPGTEFNAFDSLPKGTEVEVESVEGSWVAIRTPAGRTGYVHKTFLELPGGADEASQETPRVESTSRAAAAETGQALEVEALAVESTPRVEPPERSPTPADAPPPTLMGSDGNGRDELLVDVKRILRLTEEMHEELAGRSPADAPGAPMNDGTQAPGVASTLALSGIGLLFGFLLGSVYGRRQERNRRSRVRF